MTGMSQRHESLIARPASFVLKQNGRANDYSTGYKAPLSAFLDNPVTRRHQRQNVRPGDCMVHNLKQNETRYERKPTRRQCAGVSRGQQLQDSE